MKIAVLIITFDRIEDAKINMDIITQIWSKNQIFNSIDIYHAFNGDLNNYPKPYLEKIFIHRNNLGHYQGAADLIDAGIKKIIDSNYSYDYIFVMSGDVWLIKPYKLAQILLEMENKHYLLAASLWPNTFFEPTIFASEFFIISPSLARKVFPFKMKQFYQNHKLKNLLIKITKHTSIIRLPQVEVCFTSKVMDAISCSFFSLKWMKHVRLLPGREIVYGINRFYSPRLGYLSHHDLEKKKKLAHEMILQLK
jgi:hypothetical protein